MKLTPHLQKNQVRTVRHPAALVKAAGLCAAPRLQGLSLTKTIK